MQTKDDITDKTESSAIVGCIAKIWVSNYGNLTLTLQSINWLYPDKS